MSTRGAIGTNGSPRILRYRMTQTRGSSSAALCSSAGDTAGNEVREELGGIVIDAIGVTHLSRVNLDLLLLPLVELDGGLLLYLADLAHETGVHRELDD